MVFDLQTVACVLPVPLALLVQRSAAVSPEVVRARRPFAVFARVATALSFLIAVLDLLVGNFGVVALISLVPYFGLVPYFVSMKPITAFAFWHAAFPVLASQRE